MDGLLFTYLHRLIVRKRRKDAFTSLLGGMWGFVNSLNCNVSLDGGIENVKIKNPRDVYCQAYSEIINPRTKTITYS